MALQLFGVTFYDEKVLQCVIRRKIEVIRDSRHDALHQYF
jgi:hypothetical protein